MRTGIGVSLIVGLLLFFVGCAEDDTASRLYQEQLKSLQQQRDQLEADRREIIRNDRSFALSANLIAASVMLFCSMLPLALVAYLAWLSGRSSEDRTVTDYLVDQVRTVDDASTVPRLEASANRRRLLPRREA